MTTTSNNAHDAATTWRQAAAGQRNMAIRQALVHLRNGYPDRAYRVMLMSVHSQAWLEGLER